MACRIIAVVPLAAALLSACGAGEVKRTRFEAFDWEALNEEFTEPTGVLAPDLVQELLADQLDDSLKFAAKGVGGMLEKVLEPASDETTGTLQSALTVTSSNAYIRVSCPGPIVDKPDLDFGHGEVRVDAPGILPSKAAIKDGDVLLSFKDCISDRMLLAATTSAYYDLSRGLIFELDLRRSTLDGNPVEFEPMKFRIGKGRIEVLVELSAGTFVANVAELPNKIDIRGANTQIECQLSSGKAVCEIDGKPVTIDLKRAGASTE